MTAAALALTLATVVRAQPVEQPADWWVGLPLADVQLLAPEGGLPEESLEPLLRSEDGERLDPHLVRLDLATLYQVGEFSAVEAEIEPWTVFDAGGEPQPGALLTYVVYPAPKVARVRLQGNKEFRSRQLLDAAGLAPGQVYFETLDGPRVADRVRTFLEQEGYRDAQVEVRATEPSPGRIYVLIDVDEGEPRIVERLVFMGELEGVASDRHLRRWARRAGTHGLAEGRPLAPKAVSDVQDAIREELGAVKRGYIGARVTPAVLPGREGPHVTFTIEPGPRLELDVDGLGIWPRRKAREALQIDHRLRLTRGFLDRAPDQLRTWLQERGWYRATAAVTLDRPGEDIQVLRIDADRGSKHTLGDVPKLFSGFVSVDYTFTDGPDSVGDRRREARAIQTVIEQVSPDVLRRDLYTDAEIEIALAGVEQYYTDQGRLDAELVAGEPAIRPRATLANALRALALAAPKKRITPKVTVTRGPVTRLEELEIAGVAPEARVPWLEEERAARVGEPFSPQRLEALSRRLVEAHRDAGYLEADARVEHVQMGPQSRSSTVTIEPGTRILLRSVVTRGTRLTRPGFVQREVGLQLGQPISSSDLDRVRSDLNDLGIFRTVSLDLIGDEEARDLVVGVTERARWAIEIGGGVSTDQGIRTFGRVTRRNLFGRAHRLQLIGQVGLDYRSDNLRDWVPDIVNPEWRLATSYTAPRFPLRSQELVLDVVLRERRQERTWQMDRTGAGAALAWDLARSSRLDTTIRTGFRVESRRLNEVDTAALLQGEPWTADIDLELPDLPSRWRAQEAVTALLIHDWRDDRVQPSRGALLSLTGEWAPGLPWDEWRDQPRTAFLKGQARISSYVPLGGLVLHVAMGGGGILSLDEGLPPLEDRYRLGGTGSLRGFVRDGVGPHNIAGAVAVDWPDGIGPVIDYTSRNAAERWVPTGGDTVADGTLELLLPLPALGLTRWEGYAGALFVDAGNVWLRNPNARASSTLPAYADLVPTLRYGVGAGARVATPVGPLQLDVAVNPQAMLAEGAQRALLVRGWEEPSWRAHLTLGAVF